MFKQSKLYFRWKGKHPIIYNMLPFEELATATTLEKPIIMNDPFFSDEIKFEAKPSQPSATKKATNDSQIKFSIGAKKEKRLKT